MSVKVIISGGGTGGHIFPAISIADALKKALPECEILFVGASGRMEMERVPAAGYKIEGLPVAGFQRRITWKNVTFFFKLASSMMKARRIVRRFKPDVAVGVGGYASGPVLRAAASMGVATLIQEQNSFPGVTNRILSRKADSICVAYPGMERFFPAEKISFTGNPVRRDLTNNVDLKEANKEFGLNSELPTILVIGGSLGAGSINKGISGSIEELRGKDVQVLWQTGKFYFDDINEMLKPLKLDNVRAMPFISRMDMAYSVADVVVSRAGAGTISELALLGKASILVPSPNVSEDHQTKNAMALVDNSAAILVSDADAPHKLLAEALNLLSDGDTRESLSRNIRSLAKPNADMDIAARVLKLAELDK